MGMRIGTRTGRHIGIPPVPPVHKATSREKGTGEQHPFKAVLDKALRKTK